MNGIDYLDRGWRSNPQGACLINGDTGSTQSYDEVRRFTLVLANALRGHGYGIGDKLAVLSHNDPTAFSVVLGGMRAGLAYIPVNARNTIRDNARILEAFDCDILFVNGELADHTEEIARIAPHIRQIVAIDRAATGAWTLAQWSADYPATPFDLPHDPERPFEILPTGGTTGFPKAVIWPNRMTESILANFMATAPCEVPPVFLAAAPLTHLSGKFMQYFLASGGTGVVIGRPDRHRILELIERYRITHLFLPPTVIYDLLLEPDVAEHDYSSLRYFMYSGAPMSPEKLRRAVEVFGPVMCQVWGQSEAAWLSILLPEDHLEDGAVASPQRLASCGRPFPFVTIEVMDDAGTLLADGQVGEFVVRGSCVMTGYYKDAPATESASRHGWHHTGDIGYRDAGGFLYLVDRAKDMVISGGFNIYSVEVERALSEHGDVLECAVIGVPDAKWGEAVKGVVELVDGARAGPEELIAFCRERLGAMKAPKSIDVVDRIPRNPNGKVLKRELRDRYWAGRERMVS